MSSVVPPSFCACCEITLKKTPCSIYLSPPATPRTSLVTGLKVRSASGRHSSSTIVFAMGVATSLNFPRHAFKRMNRLSCVIDGSMLPGLATVTEP